MHARAPRPFALVSMLLATFLTFTGVARAQWARTFGGPGTGEGVHAIGEMSTGDIVVAATTDSFGTTTGDAWLIRLDANGRVLSQSVCGNPAPGGVDGAVVLPDGGAVFASRNVRDFFLVHDATITRVAADGTPAWTTDVTANPGRFMVNDLIAASDGSFVGVGQAAMSDAGPFVGWILRLAADGSMVWQQYHGGVIDTSLSFEAGIQASDGGFAITGWSAGGPSGEDVFVAKATATGGLSWSVTVGGTSSDRGAAIVEVPTGGYAVAGSTDSFPSSGHAGWVIRLDASGAVRWNAVLGDAEWSDLQALTVADDGNLVAFGRIGEPGFPTNDLWAVKLDEATGAILWQRAYAGDSGDYASEIALLSGSDLLLAGTWAWGFPEEDLWLLRAGSDGLIAGCSLVRDTTVTTTSPRVTASPGFLPPYPPFGAASAASVVTGTSALTAVTQCDVVACPPITCDAIVVDPLSPCEGTQQSFTLVTTGGVDPVTVTWDLDGDTVPETPGNPVLAVMPAGTTSILAVATDSCSAGVKTCQLGQDVVVRPATPPGEVSDVRGGAVPLLVLDHGARLSFEDRADATAYSLYSGAIGTWYAPGSACFVTTTPGGAGRLETAPALAPDTWVVVTASAPCAEGPAGRDSFGTARMSVGTWPACGPSP